MNIIRWNNGNQFADMFDSFFFDDYHQMHRTRKYCGPATNIIENQDEFILDLAVPGMEKSDFKVNVENSLLTISSEKKEEMQNETKPSYARREFSYASFSRSFTLPKSVNADKINASYKDGILSISIPKKEEAKVMTNKEIKVS